MMAKPIRALELHYLMVQFLIIQINTHKNDRIAETQVSTTWASFAIIVHLAVLPAKTHINVFASRS